MRYKLRCVKAVLRQSRFLIVYRHRRSDMSIDSLMSSFKNKVKYTLHQAVTDPAANDFASSLNDEMPLTETKQVEEEKPYFELPTTDDPNTFDIKRLMIKTANRAIYMIKHGFYPAIAIILSMYVANEMIMYPYPIRFIFFMFTFLICNNYMTFLVLLAAFYLCKWGYQTFLNYTSDGPKTKIMPTIFALLPLTTDIPVSSIGAFFMYPFTYPKNEKDAKQLPIIMNDYMESMKKAFTYYDKVKNLPFVAEGFQKLEENIEHLHDIPEKPELEEENTSPKTESEAETTTNNSSPKTSPTRLPPTIKLLPKAEGAEASNNSSSKANSSRLPPTIKLPSKAEEASVADPEPEPVPASEPVPTSESVPATNNSSPKTNSSRLPPTIKLPPKAEAALPATNNSSPKTSAASLPATINTSQKAAPSSLPATVTPSKE